MMADQHQRKKKNNKYTVGMEIKKERKKKITLPAQMTAPEGPPVVNKTT